MGEEESRDTLGDRMKAYEAKVTEEYLDMGTPMYARIDGRAFHTLCRGLKKPFDSDFVDVMHETCRHLVKETGANLGYVQSDEISLGWTNPSRAPFEGRMFKLTSVLASMAGASFMKNALSFGSGEIWSRAQYYVPTFDCRVFNLPSVEELVNAFIWRQNDCIKNAVSSIANSLFSVNELNRKNQAEQKEMIRAKGHPFESYPEHLRIGAFFKRVNVLKAVDPEIAPKIKEEFRHVNENGEWCVMRSEVQMVQLGRITELEDRAKILFDYVQEEEK